jgi:hypothetical protein
MAAARIAVTIVVTITMSNHIFDLSAGPVGTVAMIG